MASHDHIIGDPRNAPIITLAPEVKFDFKNVPPPTNLYVTLDDTFYLSVLNSVPGVTLDFHYRILLVDGTIHRAHTSFVVPSDRSDNSFTIPTAEGFLLGCSIGAGGPSVKIGQMYVALRLLQGQLPAALTTQVLLGGYIGGRKNLVYPGTPPVDSIIGPGYIRHIIGTTPAAGAEIVETVPVNARWRVRGINFNLVTGAAVANRRVRVAFDNGVNNFFLTSAFEDQLASAGVAYNAAEFGTFQALMQGQSFLPIPNNVLLISGGRFRTISVGLQAADQYSSPTYQVEEWLEE